MVQEAETAQAKIFIVHGRNHIIRDKIDLFLRDLGLQTIVMEAGTQGGLTLPEKFEKLAGQCTFAVFIFSADDELVYQDSNKKVKRARQNVILELGYFWGALGRQGHLALLMDNDPEMELPSDIQGICWIPITDDLGETKLRLQRELEKVGLFERIGKTHDIITNFDTIQVFIESKHRGEIHPLRVSPRATVKWLVKQAVDIISVKNEVEVGTSAPLKLRWILVDVKAEDYWQKLSRFEQQRLRALIKAKDGIRTSHDNEDCLVELGIYEGVIFHIYPFQDMDYKSDSLLLTGKQKY